MFVQWSMNRKINQAFRKLGKSTDVGVEIFPECEQNANELLESLKEEVLIELKITKTIEEHTDPIVWAGYTIAKASGRDSGAFIPPNVALISGRAYSGGSMKNWYTIIKEGTVLRIRVSKILFEKYQNENEAIEARLLNEQDSKIKIGDLL